jgi:hypothetical protein
MHLSRTRCSAFTMHRRATYTTTLNRFAARVMPV